MRFPHDGSSSCVGFDPSGKYLLVSGEKRVAKLFWHPNDLAVREKTYSGRVAPFSPQAGVFRDVSEAGRYTNSGCLPRFPQPPFPMTSPHRTPVRPPISRPTGCVQPSSVVRLRVPHTLAPRSGSSAHTEPRGKVDGNTARGKPCWAALCLAPGRSSECSRATLGA